MWPVPPALFTPARTLPDRRTPQTVSWEAYNAKLESLNLIVKARNFLVFQVRAPRASAPTCPAPQLVAGAAAVLTTCTCARGVQGDVESIAQKSPTDLSKMFENISG